MLQFSLVQEDRRTGGLEDWRTGGLKDWRLRTGGLEYRRTGRQKDWRTRGRCCSASLVAAVQAQCIVHVLVRVTVATMQGHPHPDTSPSRT